MCAAAIDTYVEAGLSTVVISGVLPGNELFDYILSSTGTEGLVFNAIWLTCTEDQNRRRLRDRDGHERNYLDLSEYLDSSRAVRVDSSSIPAEDVVKTILGLL